MQKVNEAFQIPNDNDAFQHSLGCSRWIPYDEHHKRYDPSAACSCCAEGAPPVGVEGRWDKSGLKAACQRGLDIGRTHQEFDIQLLLDMLNEIERLESLTRSLDASKEYVRGLSDAKATAEYFFDQRDAKHWSPIQTQGGIVEDIDALISQHQETK